MKQTPQISERIPFLFLLLPPPPAIPLTVPERAKFRGLVLCARFPKDKRRNNALYDPEIVYALAIRKRENKASGPFSVICEGDTRRFPRKKSREKKKLRRKKGFLRQDSKSRNTGQEFRKKTFALCDHARGFETSPNLFPLPAGVPRWRQEFIN